MTPDCRIKEAHAKWDNGQRCNERFVQQGPVALAILLFWLLSVAVGLGVPPRASGAESQEIWLQIDTQALELRVMRGERTIRRYPDIAIGRSGTSTDKRRRDGKTPLGEYRIDHINEDSPFHLFFRFDYPRLEQAKRAYHQGDLSAAEYQAIREAIRIQREPPHDTALGGLIGIHGIGKGDPRVHRDFNWTFGCVALTNEQIDQLRPWVRLGTRVVLY